MGKQGFFDRPEITRGGVILQDNDRLAARKGQAELRLGIL